MPIIKDRLTAAEVRQLPVGSKIVIHGKDRKGNLTEASYTLVQSGRKKILKSGDKELLIRDVPNKVYVWWHKSEKK